MWNRFSLRHRIYLIMAALVIISSTGAMIMVTYTYRMENVLTAIVERNLAAYQSAEALETALINQKGFVSYYFLDGDPDWLKQLGEYRQIFKEQLNRARAIADTAQQRRAIDQIQDEYTRYITERDSVIQLYQSNQREVGAELHQKVRRRFFTILEHCEAFKGIQHQRMISAREETLAKARGLRVVAAVGILIAFALAGLLLFVLVNHILRPVRQLIKEAGYGGSGLSSADEIKTLSTSVRGLIEDVDHTHMELQRSRESLQQSEKMAMVGKLAAGMAHSIRNPFTSVKMRLFSLNRSLELNETQKEDFDVISEEIRHIDTIVQNFLEFSRPPRLKIQSVSPSVVVDQVLQLLEHRLKSYDADVKVNRSFTLPEIKSDPERLKEVLVNLLVNACEAMGPKGCIDITEEISFDDGKRPWIVIRVSDNGPGITPANQARVFQPFFTTKEEGTGLGLSIVNRIIREHGGRIDVRSESGRGTSFTITLPIKETASEYRPDY